MDRRTLLAGGAGLLIAALVGAPASARVVSQTDLGHEAAPETIEVRRGGRGRGWAASRGRKVGWRRGRGRAWGRRRRFGW